MGYGAVMSFRLPLVTLALLACGTETPRTTKPDAGFPAAPFDKPAPLIGAEAGTDAGSQDAGSQDAGGEHAGTEQEGGAAAPVSSALVDVKPFTIALVATGSGELRLESGDRQSFTIQTKDAAGPWFATKQPGLASGELARWTAGGTELTFRRSADRIIVVRMIVRADGGTGSTPSKELRFVAPPAATLFVESRGAADAGTR